MKSVSLVAVAVSLIVAASVVLELVAGQDSYKLYLAATPRRFTKRRFTK